MSAIDIFLVVVLVAVGLGWFVSFLSAIQFGWSKDVRIRITRPRRKEAGISVALMDNVGKSKLCLEALCWSLGGLHLIPAVFVTWMAFLNGVGTVAGSIALWIVFGFWFVLAARLRLVKTWRDIFSKPATMIGIVKQHWVEEKEVPTQWGPTGTQKEYGVTIEKERLNVSEKIYYWLSKGDKVVVSYWPHSKRVATVEMLSRTSPVKERPKDIYLSLLSELAAKGGFVTFRYRENEDIWVQVLFSDEETQVNFGYPYDEDPNQLISKRDISFPTGFTLSEWDAQINATFTGPKCPHSKLANTIDALFTKLLGAPHNYVVEGQIE